MRWRLLRVGVISVAALSAERVSAQDPVSRFYKGKQITVVVGSSAGGGYDTYARLLSRHMPKHIPGPACAPPLVGIQHEVKSGCGRPRRPS